MSAGYLPNIFCGIYEKEGRAEEGRVGVKQERRMASPLIVPPRRQEQPGG